MRTCIYTAIFGNYTTLKAPHGLSNTVDLICFTDDAHIAAAASRSFDGWEIRRRRPVFAHPRMDSKWHRMNSDLVLPEYDVTIWVDASFQLGNIDRFVEFCVKSMGSRDTALFKHPERSDIYTEAAASTTVWRNKYADQPLLEQVEHYRRLGLPEDHGLWAGGIQIRRKHSSVISELNRRWFAECVRWSTQDQLSLPYVLWKIGYRMPSLPGSVYQGEDYEWTRGEDR